MVGQYYSGEVDYEQNFLTIIGKNTVILQMAVIKVLVATMVVLRKVVIVQ